MRSKVSAYIGVGANLGDPIQQIVDARSMLFKLRSTVEGRSSSMYMSSPVGFAQQPNFINCVFELNTLATASELFSEMQSIELSLGRLRDQNNQNAPRVIDLDLLLFGDASIDTDLLMVPHPRMVERRFVLEPLVELTPDITIQGNNVASILLQQNFDDQVIHRLTL